MPLRLIATAFLMTAIVTITACQTSSEQTPGGPWIEAIGTAWSPQADPQGLARNRAIEAAEEDARAKIRVQFSQIEARPGVSLQKAMEDDPYVWSRIMGLLKATKSDQTEIDPQGKVTARVRLSLPQLREIAIYAEEAA